MMFKKFAVAIDGSDNAERTFDAACELAANDNTAWLPVSIFIIPIAIK